MKVKNAVMELLKRREELLKDIGATVSWWRVQLQKQHPDLDRKLYANEEELRTVERELRLLADLFYEEGKKP